MKRFLASIILLTPFALAHPAMAVSAPSQCSGMTFDNTIVVIKHGVVVNGTSGRDLIIVQKGGSKINGLGADDCIVLQGWGNSVAAGAGNDVIVDQSGGASINGNGGVNKCYLAKPSSDSVANCTIL